MAHPVSICLKARATTGCVEDANINPAAHADSSWSVGV